MDSFAQFRAFTAAGIAKAKAHKGFVATLAVIVILQLYFVQELVAAELLFGLGFMVLLVLGVVFYVVGSLGERLFNASDAAARILARSAKRGFLKLEVAGRKSFGHPRSESAR